MTVTRFAPSPTGHLHLGHAFAALTAARGGEHFLLRIEDLDPGRAREEFVTSIFEDLRWLGLTWNEPVLRQSARMDVYRDALFRLQKEELLYPCFCSRADIADEIARAMEAPHVDPLSATPTGPDGPHYPGTCRHLNAKERLSRIASGAPYALRLDVTKAAKRAGPLTFREKSETVAVDPFLFGDLVLARKDVPASYHLSVVVDDAFQGVDLVTRGEDLLPAAHVQRLLQALLQLPEPAYAHHRLILDEEGRKFSKRDQAVTLRQMREEGAKPGDIQARLGFEAFAMLSRGPMTDQKSSAHPLDKLYATVMARKAEGNTGTSYTAKLLSQGVEKCAKKFGEEAVEAALASVSGDKQHLAAESADVIYHLLVLWAAAGITADDVYGVLKQREAQSGLAEKASRSK